MIPVIMRVVGRFGTKLLTRIPKTASGSSFALGSKIESIAAKYMPKALNVFRTGASVSKNVMPKKGMIGKLLNMSTKRQLVRLRRIAKNPFLMKAFNVGTNLAFLAMMFKDWKSDPSITSDGESLKQIEEAEAAMTVLKQLTPYADISDSNLQFVTLSARERSLSTMIQSLVFNRYTLTGNELDDVSTARLASLDDEERLFCIAALVALTKRFCENSDASEVLNAFRIQATLSNQIFSVPTRGFESLIKKDHIYSPMIEDAAEQYVSTMQGFSEEYSQSAFQSFFDETTNILLDPKDIFGGDSGVDWSADKEEWASVRTHAQVSCLATDSQLNTLTSWLDKWAVDSDGKDDESRALDTMLKYQSVALNYEWFITNIANGKSSQAANFITRS